MLRRAGLALPMRVRERLFPGMHPFDLRHGTDSSGLLYAPDLPTGNAHDANNEGYYASAPSMFRRLVERWQTTLAEDEMSTYAFIDLGCGKGRVLLMAAEFPLRSITGVEMHAGLGETARQNVARWLRRPRACARIEVVTGDALSFDLPDGPVVLFLFNSFDAEVVRELRERLVEAARVRTAPIDLLYVHPDQAEVLGRSPWLELLVEEEIPFSAEDAAADFFKVNTDLCHIYRIAGRAGQ